jgi:hypothetical protein
MAALRRAAFLSALGAKPNDPNASNVVNARLTNGLRV